MNTGSFQELSGRLGAEVGIAIASADGRTQLFGAWTSGVAWSTIKVPLVVAALRAGASAPVAEVITHSDNAAAEELWSELADRAAQLVQAVIREAGDPATVVESRRLRAEYTPFGQTRWSLIDQARFAAGLTQIADAAPVVELMRSLCAEHRWGLAAKGLAAKGGWGPGFGDDYLVRQFGILPTESGIVGVALAADVPDGGYEAGIEVVDKLADWVIQRLTQK
jgi:hypothetical protein